MEPLFEEHVKFAAPLGMLRYNQEQMRATGPAGVATHIAAGSNFREVINNRAWFAGSQEDTIDYLKEIEEKYPGLEQVIIAFPIGESKAQFTQQITRFAREVMPAFRTQSVTA